MNTPAHVVFSLALCGRNNAWLYPVAIAFGALLPDLPMVGFYAWHKLAGTPESAIWREHYFLAEWQVLFDSFNSIPLIVVGIALAFWRQWSAMLLLFVSMLIHCLLDLPVHHDDGHRHFFPLSGWRFESPVSYWDPAHYGQVVGVVEILLVLAAIVWLWRKPSNAMRSPALRLTLAACLVIYCEFFWFVVTTWSGMA